MSTEPPAIGHLTMRPMSEEVSALTGRTRVLAGIAVGVVVASILGRATGLTPIEPGVIRRLSRRPAPC